MPAMGQIKCRQCHFYFFRQLLNCPRCGHEKEFVCEHDWVILNYDIEFSNWDVRIYSVTRVTICCSKCSKTITGNLKTKENE